MEIDLGKYGGSMQLIQNVIQLWNREAMLDGDLVQGSTINIYMCHIPSFSGIIGLVQPMDRYSHPPIIGTLSLQLTSVAPDV